MNLQKLLIELHKNAVKLRRNGDSLGIRAAKSAMDLDLMEHLKVYKHELLALIDHSGEEWWCPPRPITPEMLTLIKLSQEEIDYIVSTVPGGTANVQDIYPLAPLQEGILFHHLVSEKGDAYLQSGLYVFDTREALDSYTKVLQTVVNRHDILRTAILWEHLKEPVQVVWRKAPIQVEEITLAPTRDAIEQLNERYNPDHYRLDVRQAPMFKICVAHDPQKQCWLFLVLLHHLVGDHTTLEVIQEEIYTILAGEEDTLPAPIPYRNLVAQALLGADKKEHETFFKEMLGEVDEPTAPFDILDIRGESHRIAEASLEIAETLNKRLRERTRQLGVSAASLCHQAWAHVLSLLTGREEVVFGTVLFGRMQGSVGVKRGIGLFINTLPIKVKVTKEPISSSIRHTHSLLANLMRHEHASLTLAQRCSGVHPPTPLFTTLLNYRHHEKEEAESLSTEELKTDPLQPEPSLDKAQETTVDGTPTAEESHKVKEEAQYEIHAWEGKERLFGQERTDYPIALAVDDTEDGLHLGAFVHPALDPLRICQLMQTALESLVDALERYPLAPAANLKSLPDEERRQVLETWNATEQPYQDQACFHELFEAHAQQAPDALAITCGERSLTYGQLNHLANQWAHRLRSLGVGPDSRVAICLVRSVEMVVGLLATLKAGGAYVPMDPAYPVDRLRYMLEDSAPTVLLTHDGLASALDLVPQDSPLPVLDLTQPVLDQPAGNLSAAQVGVGPGHLAYVIYTSGSTGQPKGVMVEHHGLCSQALLHLNYLNATPDSRVMQFSSFSFDACVFEVLMAFCSGASLHVPPGGVPPMGEALEHFVAEKAITHAVIPPAVLAALPESVKLASLRTLVSAGEALPEALVKRWGVGRRLINAYGPTETTICATAHECSSEAQGNPPIGAPIVNTKVYLLDSQQRPVPIGVPGEMYIGGAGIARGYLNRPDLTQERFLADPFAGKPGARMYKSGDLARWRTEGELDFLGRNDFQVKIRGFRIELGEIESRLLSHGAVQEAVVLAREDSASGKRLVAYVVPQGGQNLSADGLKQYLLAALPDYMVPSAFVMMERLPLTPNGKLDRKALPALEGSATARQYVAPQTETERILANLWKELLGVDRVGRFDNFFELGGHSLLSVSLMERMREQGLQTDVRAVFAASHLAALAAALGDASDQVSVPPNLIPDGCTAITPEMLPLVALTEEEIHSIVANVPGGAANVQDIYPLAPLQEGILFHHLMSEGGDAYLTPFLFSFGERDTLDAFVKGLQAVVDRHDTMRTSMAWEGLQEPVQVVWRQAVLDVEEVALDPHQDAEAQFKEQVESGEWGLDLRQAPMLRLFVGWDEGKGRWLLQLLFHHLLGDHTTMEVVEQEIQAYLAGQLDQLPPPAPFRNLVAQARLGVSREEHETFFRQMLGDVESPTAPFGWMDIQRDGSGIVEGQKEVNWDLGQRLRACARSLGISAASICHQAWAHVLAALTQRQDVVFGTILFGRMQGGEGSERGIGLFINTLPIRIAVGAEGAAASVRQTHRLLADLMRHELAPLGLAQRCSGLHRGAPLFTSLFNYRHSGVGGWDDGDACATDADNPDPSGGMEQVFFKERTNYPLVMALDDLGEAFVMTVQIDESVEPLRVCELMHESLASLVEALEHTPSTPTGDLNVLPSAERRLVLDTWNDTAAPFPDLCIHQCFEKQVLSTPDAPALSDGQQSLTYTQLNAQANRLARHLVALGVKPDALVALCLERSLEMVVGMLAILKAGGAYVPLDPAYPADRVRHMLEDSQPVAILTQDALTEMLADHLSGLAAEAPKPVLVNVNAPALWAAQAADNLDVTSLGLTPRHLAYVIYTSGSTGKPKGVMIEHHSLVNHMTWMQQAFPLVPGDSVIQKTPISFDASVWEFYAPLLCGARLVMAPPGLHRDPEGLVRVMQQESIHTLQGVPTLINLVLDVPALKLCKSLKRVFCGGEALSPRLVERFHHLLPGAEMINLYGPTETTIDATAWVCPRGRNQQVLIGRPVANTRAYILDAKRRPVPIGVPGELYIGGEDVARGYLHLPALTAERFFIDPFVRSAMVYKTGDLARWMPDGTLDFLGRNDFQVKFRGFRIELGEIESVLRDYPGIKESVVLVREDQPGDKRLVGYVTLLSMDKQLDQSALRQHASSRLPDYMVPSALVWLESLPLTPSGKVDVKALPVPEGGPAASQAYVAPLGEVESLLATLWSDLLGVPAVGRFDNFFELGGHSLLTVTLIERMRKAGLHADVRALFASPTIAALAKATQGKDHALVVPPNGILPATAHITPDMLPLIKLTQGEIDLIVSAIPGGVTNIQDIYPLAPLQEGILFHHVTTQEGDAFLLPNIFAFDTQDKLEAFADAMQAVIDRHDALRTAFLWEGLSEPVQVVCRRVKVSRETLTLDPHRDAEDQLHERYDMQHYRLDVRQGTMVHLGIAYDVSNQVWLMMVILHHLASDHTTLEVIREEIQAHLLGEAEHLPPPVPYRNLIAQVRLGVSREEHETFFRQMLGDVEEPTAPFGLLDVQRDGSDVVEARLEVAEELALRMRESAKRLGVSVASLCHQAWAQVLSALTGREDVVFGTLLFGRMQGTEGADRAVGLYLNTLPIRVRVGAQGVADSIKETHALLAALMRHEHASLAVAQRCSGVHATLPLFTAPLNYRHSEADFQAPDEASMEAWEGMTSVFAKERGNYPMSLDVDDAGDGFLLTAQVVSSIDPERICAFMYQALMVLVDTLEEAPRTPVNTLPMLPDNERHLVLEGWNDTAQAFPGVGLAQAIFEAQAARQPDAVALIQEEVSLTYGELNARANRLAHHLRSIGVKPDVRVAICVEKSIAMMVAMLAVLKAGGAYLPMDPTYPRERLLHMLQDGQPLALLMKRNFIDLLGQALLDDLVGVTVVDLSQSYDSQPDVNPDPVTVGLESHHLAYVCYTSGSTGLPKGVMIEHRSLWNLCHANQQVYHFQASDRFLQFIPYHFDGSIEEIFGAFHVGGALVLRGDDWSLDATSFWRKVQHHQITVVDLPTRFWQLLATEKADIPACLRMVLIYGEAVEDRALEAWFNRKGHIPRLFNTYGPTETTVNATLRELTEDPATWDSLGKPLANVQLYVLNGVGLPAPMEVPGELYIGGAGVGRGYLNRPELTAEKFVPHPFVDVPADGEPARLYRTGDWVSWLPDGSIQFIGRNDFQVKIRGFRIEPGEIEAKLLALPNVKEAAVVAREDEEGDRRLVAYVVPAEMGAVVEVEPVREHLLANLPEYMVPAAFMILPALPLTPNGKLDRKRLPAPEGYAYSSRAYEEPQGEVEVKLAAIWAEVLKVDKVSRNDNFFELGGHSLLAMTLMERMRQQSIPVDIHAVFAAHTMAELAAAAHEHFEEMVVPDNLIPDLPPPEKPLEEGDLEEGDMEEYDL